MSHVKTVEAFEKLLGICTGYGGAYNPGQQNLRIDTLTAKLEQAREALANVNVIRSQYDSEVNSRAIAFGNISRLASSIIFRLVASGVSKQALDDARFFLRQISGRRAKYRAPILPDPAPPAQGFVPANAEPGVRRSGLQLAYSSKADHFARLVQAAGSEPLYTSNEPELSIDGLTEKLETLRGHNSSVTTASVEWNKSLRERDKVLYENPDSVVNTARAVRMYVRSVFGINSPEYRPLKALKFKSWSR